MTAAELRDLIADFLAWYDAAARLDLDPRFGEDLEGTGFVARMRDAVASPTPCPLAEARRRELRLDLAGRIIASSNPLGSAGQITPPSVRLVEPAFQLADYVIAYHDDPTTPCPAVAAQGWPRVARVAPAVDTAAG